jgi:LPS export ABC transporter protein LptC
MSETQSLWRSVRLSVILFSGLLGAGFLPEASAMEPGRPNGGSPGLVLRQVHMIETRDGSKLWEIRADQVAVDEREGLTVLSRGADPIRIAFYSSQGKSTCEANRATLDLKTKDVSLEGGVVARSEQGMELKTERLRWMAASRRLQTDQPVTITRGTLISRGQGMEAETDLERVRIFQNITSEVGPVPGRVGRSRPR